MNTEGAALDSAKDKNYDEVLKEGEEVRALYPDYVYAAQRLRISGRGGPGAKGQAAAVAQS